MKTPFFFLCLFLGYGQMSQAQIIQFADQELKTYLIQELCVDTTQNGVSFSNDLSVDLNGDQEIQVAEALQVTHLELKDFQNLYNILAIDDLNAFANLKYLKMWSIDGIDRVSNLALDSLKHLWISDAIQLKVIDLSNLTNLTESLRIEGLTNLDTLNIQNGSVAAAFSLFYTFDVPYACIDDLPKEWEEFDEAGAMLPGILPVTDCGIVSINAPLPLAEQIQLFPNPASDYIYLETELEFTRFQIRNILNQPILESPAENRIDVSGFSKGIYFLRIKVGEQWITKDFLVQ